jgi:dynein heavy chain
MFSKVQKLPLFQIELLKHSSDDIFVYNTNPNNFVTVILAALKKALDEMSKIPDLEPKILADLYKSQKLETYIKSPLMPVQEPVDPDPNERPLKYPDENKWIWELVNSLRGDVEAAIEPLNQYLRVFDQFIPVLQLRPDEYVLEIELEDNPRDIEVIKDEIMRTK